MLKKKIVLKFILGLKIRQLRARRDLSLKELADRADLSSSYLNEIENGKKYPKIEKLAAIAQGLEVDLEDLVSFKTGRNLHPLLRFLEGDIVAKVPLELFGLEETDVVDLMGKDPEKFASFVLTVLQLSRSFDMKLDDLYDASLRSFIEVNDNYFPEIEKLAKKMRETWGGARVFEYRVLVEMLQQNYGVLVNDTTLGADASLENVNYYFKSSHPMTVFLNPKLHVSQRKFYLLKSVGHILLCHETKNQASGLACKILDFKSSYFSNAALLEEKIIIKELKAFFSQSFFTAHTIHALIEKYGVSPELIFHRLTQILPSHFKINEIFFLGMSSNASGRPGYVMNKELHLSQLHRPHGVRMNENYCQRWVAIRSIEALKLMGTSEQASSAYVTGQISRVEEGTEYFSISLARRSPVRESVFQSFTIGFLINKELKSIVKFLEDPHLKKTTIGQTCERCSQLDCAERTALPVLFEQALNKGRREELLQNL